MSESYKFDEYEAVKFISEFVGKEISSKYDEDEILYIIDIIWDLYEKNGYLILDDDPTDEELFEVDRLTAFVKKELANDKEVLMDPDDVEMIVKGDLEYEKTIEDFI